MCGRRRTLVRDGAAIAGAAAAFSAASACVVGAADVAGVAARAAGAAGVVNTRGRTHTCAWRTDCAGFGAARCSRAVVGHAWQPVALRSFWGAFVRAACARRRRRRRRIPCRERPSIPCRERPSAVRR
eukprot:355536-Chlamydomonas_euryale.AAC.2